MALRGGGRSILAGSLCVVRHAAVKLDVSANLRLPSVCFALHRSLDPSVRAQRRHPSFASLGASPASGGPPPKHETFEGFCAPFRSGIVSPPLGRKGEQEPSGGIVPRARPSMRGHSLHQVRDWLSQSLILLLISAEIFLVVYLHSASGGL